MDGRTITRSFDLNGHKAKPHHYRVAKIKEILEDKVEGGKVVHIVDGDGITRFINFREITAIR